MTTSTTLTVEAHEGILSLPIPPQKIVPHDYPSVPTRSIELQRISGGGTLENHCDNQTDPTTEQSNIPPRDSVFDQKQTLWKPYMNRFRVIGCCLTGFANGMNDSAPGALISSIETHYGIGYGTVSTIFICNALGFIAAATFVNGLATRIGRGKTLIISESLLILAYTILAITPPFPVVALSFFISGIGMAINLAISQVFCASLANNTAIIGVYQGAYGIGGVVSPLIATLMISNGWIWSRFYILELGLASFNLFFASWSFWNYEKECEIALPAPTSDENISRQHSSKNLGRRWKSFKTLLKNKPTLLGSAFIFVYQGAEVAISGWIISFLVQFRHSDPSKVGYVTSGFWGGITLGRFTLSFLAHRIGERTFVLIATFGALILELTIWFIPSIPGASVFVALSGFLLGPIYPCAVHVLQKLIQPEMLISSLSVIGSLGSSGGAVAPFVTGILAQSVGTFVLHPVCIGLFVAMGVSWWVLPRVEKRDE
ncbi:MFS general substrate transporter [Glarea lozoyensis ATCC 20868]|uniref:MFS general substrate transporter n=1 Tax=Glarea lozoyensis (strain ATCC 20868 / MF5171) TaxID=1116229 RepID=S3CTV6_GLAL2|nr:MFS general substrate transporter [Glarea lozoyensis ATCC 20868]EPE29802.1 MFS general substrate transporter [Glarea lozoyensis ATCC 20868]